jgi:hypothetical protein
MSKMYHQFCNVLVSFVCLFLLAACGGIGGSGISDISDDTFPKGNQTGLPISGLYLWVTGFTSDGFNVESSLTNGAGIMLDSRFAGVLQYHALVVYTLRGDRTRLFSDTRLYDAEGSFMRTLSSIGLSVSTEPVNGEYAETMQIKTEGYDSVTKTLVDQGFSLDTMSLNSVVTDFPQPFLNLAGLWLAEDRSSSFTITSNGDFSGSDQEGCQWEGTYTQPDSEQNAYLANLSLTACEKAGSYEMFASFADSDELSHIFFNDNFASSDNWTKVQAK